MCTFFDVVWNNLQVSAALPEEVKRKRSCENAKATASDKANWKSDELVNLGSEVKKPAPPPFKFLVVRSLRLLQ